MNCQMQWAHSLHVKICILYICLSIEELQNVNVGLQPVHGKQWPLEVILALEKFSRPLKEDLSSMKVSCYHSREIVGHLANYAYAFKPYPNKTERFVVCEALVRHCPHLRNDVGAAVRGWKLKLLNKF